MKEFRVVYDCHGRRLSDMIKAIGVDTAKRKADARAERLGCIVVSVNEA